jgi:ornithine cyclodeaminase
MDGFTGRLQDLLPHVNINVTKDITDCIGNSEVIITATTSETPVIPDDKNLLEGKHFIGMGSYKPAMREFPDSLFSLISEVIVDTPHAVMESGDLSIPLEKMLIDQSGIYTLGKLINHEHTVDTGNTTFFKSVGMALFDLFTAKTVYKNALENGIGTEVDF